MHVFRMWLIKHIDDILGVWMLGALVCYVMVGVMALVNPHYIVPVVSVCGIIWATGCLGLGFAKDRLQSRHQP